MQVADKNREVKSIAMLAVVCGVLQLALSPNLGVASGYANFSLVFSACVALMMGGRRGVWAGFAAGIFYDLSSTGPIGLMALCLSISSYVLGLEERNRMSGDFGASMASYAAAAFAVSLAYHLVMLLTGNATSLLDALVYRMLPTWLLSVVAFLPFAYYYSRVRVSGPNLGGGAGHFSKRGL